MANTDPTSANVTPADGVVGTVAGWFSHLIYGTPTAGQLQATSAALDQQLANGVPGTNFSGDNSQYAPGGTIYQQIYATRGQAAADAAWQQVQGDIAAQVAQTAAIPGQIGQAAEAGAANGAQSVVDAVQGAPGKLLGLLGYQWILVGVAVLFVWLGGLVWIRNSLTKKK